MSSARRSRRIAALCGAVGAVGSVGMLSQKCHAQQVIGPIGAFDTYEVGSSTWNGTGQYTTGYHYGSDPYGTDVEQVGQPYAGTYQEGIIDFQLPSLLAGQQVVSAEVEILFADTGVTAPTYNLDLDALSVGVYAPNNDQFEAAGTPIATAIATPSSPFYTPITTDASESAALGQFINSQYTAFNMVTLRLSPDAMPSSFYDLGAADWSGMNPILYLTTESVSAASAWNIPGSGDWAVASNWTNGAPNGIDAEADFFGAATASPATISTEVPVTLGTINFNNSNTYVIASTGSLTMQVSSGSATAIVQQGTQEINVPLTIASNTTLNVSSGATLVVASPLTINAGESVTPIGSGTVSYQSSISLGSGATLAMANSASLSALNLATGATVTIASPTAGQRLLLQTDSLSIDSGATLNLANSDLIVHGGDLATVNALVQSGYANGTWQGAGIDSSAAAADTTHLTALGVIANVNSQGNALYGSGTSMGLFDGTSPAVGDILVRYTYYGDTNLDGQVDASDYSNIDNGYLLGLTGWANGDFNYDGVVNGSDYTLIDNAYNMQGAPIGAASPQAVSTEQFAGSTAVPEPAELSIVVAGAALLSRRRRRNDR